jgi:lipid II:glycine glycyltransferase (peptidoglycan interpeptide bridge formation enzyme)
MSRAILFDGDRPLVMAQFRITKIPLISTGIATASWAPLWRYEDDMTSAENHLAEFLINVRDEYCSKRGLQIRFDPRSTYSKDYDERLEQVFTQAGYNTNPAIRPYRTAILDLNLDLSKLHANLHSKWRKELRDSEKTGIELESGSSIELFDRFKKIYDEMWAKKTFATGVHIPAIYETQSTALQDQRFLIWVAKDNGKDIGAGVFSIIGNSILYFLAATSPNMRQKTNPGYSILWASVCKAKELGLRWYDLGGLTDLPDSGVDKFKTRMSGIYTMFPGRYEARSNTKTADLVDMGEKCFKLIRHKLKKQ